MATTRALFSDLYAPGLRKIIFESYTYMATEYDKFLNVLSSSVSYEDDYQMAGFGSVPTKPEGTGIIYDDPVPGSQVRYQWTAFGKGFRVTHEAMVDERYGQMKKMAAAMGRAFRNQTELNGIEIIDQAFTAGFSGFTHDGKAMCATDHPLLRGGTMRNRPSSGVDLGVSALQDALVDFERIVDDSSVPVVIRPRYLMVPPELGPMAAELLGSSFKPYTADNEINVIQDAGLQIIISHYMSDTNAWFLIADKGEHDMNWFWREKFTTDNGDDFDSGDGKMKGYMRSGVGYGDYRGVWGSPGTT
jgi:hypothetical protein